MLRETATRSFIPQRDPFIILVFHSAVALTLMHPCRGNPSQLEVTSSLQPIVALIGDDVVLPCHLDPVMDASDTTLEWARPDLNPRFVLVWRDGVDLESKKHPLYDKRTSLFTHELKSGNISLKISKVKQSDAGTYRCFVPELDRYATVQLVVGAASSPVAQINRTSSRVVLQCESAGWYPEPELLWLDSEGTLLPAGPTETLRGPDGLYNVSSRVTVEKRHSNNFTCRVQEMNINQSRETHIHVPDDFFLAISPSSPPSSPAGNPKKIIGSAISAVALILVLAVFFLLWRCKNKTRDKKTMDSKCVEEGESEPLMDGREEETAVDITGEGTNACPVPEKITECKMEQEPHEEEEVQTRKEEEEELDSRGEQSCKDERETQKVHFVSETEKTSDVCSPQEKMINPSLIIKQDKYTTEEETHKEAAVTGRGVKAEGGEGEGEDSMEAGKEESGLQLSTCTEKPKEQQLLVGEAAAFNTDAQKKPQEEDQRKLQSETRMEPDKDETGLKSPKHKDKQEPREGNKEDNTEAEKELNQGKNTPRFQPEAKPETKNVQTELKRQKDKDKPAPKNQDKTEGKPGGNKGKGRKGNQKTEKPLPVSSEVPERKDLTAEGITPEENQEKEEDKEMRAQPENLRGDESTKAAQEEVTEIKGVHADGIFRKDEEKEKLQQGKREAWTQHQLDMNETTKKEKLEPVSLSEGGVARQEEPQEPMEVEENSCVGQNGTKGRKFTRGVLHTDQQQTGRMEKYQGKHEQQGRTGKRRKEGEEKDDDDLMELEGEANNKEEVPAGPQRKRVKFQPDRELVGQEDQQDQMETQ